MTMILIPARAGSKGLPGKNYKEIAGRPLIEWTILQAKKAFPELKTVVSTNCKRCMDIACQNEVEVHYRHSTLCTDEVLMVKVLKDFTYKYKPDTIILLQPTSPLRTAERMRAMRYDFIHEKSAFMATGYTKSFFKIRSVINIRRQDSGSGIQHGMMYIYDTKYEPIGDNHLSHFQVDGFITPKWMSYEIDDEDDFDIVELLMKKHGVVEEFGNKNTEKSSVEETA